MSIDEHKFYELDPANAPASKYSAIHGSEQLKQENPKVTPRSLVTLTVVVFIVLAALAIFGVLGRMHAMKTLTKYTEADAAPPVSIEVPALQQSANEIVLPGNMQAYTMAPIYARTTGYVKAWYHDIGAHVSKGDLLAVIETPELD